MSTCDVPQTSGGLDLHTLCLLFIHTNAMRDHLETVFQHSERLSKVVTELTESALLGQRPPMGPILDLSQQQESLQGHAHELLRQGRACAQSLALQFGTRSEAAPRAVSPQLLDGLLGLIDGLAMLRPFGLSGPETARKQLRALQASVEQVLHTALRGEALAIPLGFVEAERLRLLPHGEPVAAGCACLSEAIESLQVAVKPEQG